MTDQIDPLPGFVPRKQWARLHGISDYTAHRWWKQGRIVIRRLGKEPLVDVEATIKRLRGEDQQPRRRGRPRKVPVL
jgi:predicted site-specific integrase-resolvase